MVDKYVAALILNDIGTLLELNGADPFRAKAFYTAARALEQADAELPELLRTDRLRALPGIGPTTARVVEELAETGGSTLHTELRERTPEGMIELLAVPGLGPRRIHLLKEALGAETLEQVEQAAASGRIAALAGFGPKTQRKILDGIAFVHASVGRARQPAAFRAADRLIGFLEGLPDVQTVKLSGELRRRLETVAAVEVIVATERSDAVLDAFLALPGLVAAERDDARQAHGRYADGLPLRLLCAAPDSFAAAWLVATGSDAHVEELQLRAAADGLRLDAEGLWQAESRVPTPDEAAIYHRLGLEYIPPELREGVGEVEQAAAGEVPDLVDYGDLRGCFHCHTDYSDGKTTLAEMAEGALERGWSYLGIADHSQAAGYAGGLTPERIREQHAEIDAWNAARGKRLWLFKGIEADILPDGRLDYAEYGDDVLGSFDYVVASIHSSFAQDEAAQTARVIKALSNPHVTFLGHPTGRLLLTREGYRLDLEAVVREAARLGVGIEINANPRRLELDWRWWGLARSLGVRAAINPDAHSPAGLDDVSFGLGVARKGGLGKDDVVNAWDRRRVQRYLAGRRE